MYAAGVGTKDRLIGNGQLRRVHVEGDKAGSRNGWYVLHDDGAVPAGAFGSWKTGLHEKWCATASDDLKAEQREAWRAQREQRQREQNESAAERRARARQHDARLWADSKPAEVHPYLKTKLVGGYGLRVSSSGQLLIPLYTASGLMAGIQRISASGDKRFTAGSEPRGCYFPIGGKPSDRGRLIIAEGYATAATLHEATGEPTAVAFNCGNLEPVALALREKLPKAQLIIAADNDRATEGNPGVSHAQSAAQAAKARVIVPRFYPGEKGTDFNDILMLRGPGAVRAAIEGHWDLKDLYRTEFPDPVWIVVDVLPSGLALMVGAPKAGKSRLATNIALAAGNGGTALGGWPASKCSVLYLDLEQGPRESRGRFVDMMPDRIVPDNVFIAHEWPVMGAGCLRKIRAHLAAEPSIKLVIVDTLARVWDDSKAKRGGNAYHVEYELLSQWKALANEAEVCLLLIHHYNKGGETSGTQAMTGVPDVLLFLTRQRGKPTAKLEITGREVREQDHELHFDRFTGTWSVSRATSADQPFN